MLSRIPAKYRKLVYLVAAILGGASIAFGFVAPETFSTTVDSVVRLLQQLTALLAAAVALGNLTPDTADADEEPEYPDQQP